MNKISILHGDCCQTLKTLAAASVHCCITSPPYWGLRDYKTEPLDWPAIAYSPMHGLPACVEIPAMRCSLGLEPTVEAFIGHLILVFRAVWRVLRNDATLWINMGDSYTGDRGSNHDTAFITGLGKQESNAAADKMKMTASRRRDNHPIPRSDMTTRGLKPKNMVGQPWRLALALQADGWILRQEVIWAKPNPMPESSRDRCTKAHESFFILAKRRKYYFDAKAIEEPVTGGSHPRKKVGGWAGKDGNKPGTQHDAISANSHGTPKAQLAGADRSNGAYADGKSERMGRGAGWRVKNNPSFHEATGDLVEMRNKRSVWEVSTAAFSEAHFATFPPALIEPAILAGCPPGGTVLDCCAGALTTGLVCDRNGRNAILCELSEPYIDMGDRRLRKEAKLFADIEHHVASTSPNVNVLREKSNRRRNIPTHAVGAVYGTAEAPNTALQEATPTMDATTPPVGPETLDQQRCPA